VAEAPPDPLDPIQMSGKRIFERGKNSDEMPGLRWSPSSDSDGPAIQGHGAHNRDHQNLPVFQCERCAEYSMDDPTFARVEGMLARTDKAAELEIVSFAA
jgi:hypothetical protein